MNNFALEEFAGRTALVVGGTSGIGKATVEALARLDCNVALAGIETDVGEAVAASVLSLGAGRGLYIQTDVREEAAVMHMVHKAVERFGRIHYAVNNAGYEGGFGPIQDAEERDFDRIVGTNLKGVWLGMKHQIRHMLAHGGGAIVNTSSSAGVVSIPNIGIYSASKHGIIGLSKAAALEQARSNVRVNVIAPGPVKTGLLDRMVGGHIELDAIAALVPMGRISTPEEIAAGIVWLCSDAASFVTGHVLVADGGLTVA